MSGPLKRHPALQDLSRDHHGALIQAHQILKAVDGDGDGDGAVATDDIAALARGFLNFWREEAAYHFREEEDVLLPVLSRHGRPTNDAAVRHMLDDHAWFRDAAPQLQAQVAADDVSRTLLRDIAHRLQRHVRLEESELFEHLQATLTEDDLDDVAERSAAFREEWRGPDSIGPYRGGSGE